MASCPACVYFDCGSFTNFFSHHPHHMCSSSPLTLFLVSFYLFNRWSTDRFTSDSSDKEFQLLRCCSRSIFHPKSDAFFGISSDRRSIGGNYNCLMLCWSTGSDQTFTLTGNLNMLGQCVFPCGLCSYYVDVTSLEKWSIDFPIFSEHLRYSSVLCIPFIFKFLFSTVFFIFLQYFVQILIWYSQAFLWVHFPNSCSSLMADFSLSWRGW